MLTPVTEAKSANDQSRVSRSSRIAAPADSRLTAALRPYPDTTQAYLFYRDYLFLSTLCCALLAPVYTLWYTF